MYLGEMGESELVTVFRTAESAAEEEAASIVDLLRDAGLQAEQFNDDTVDVPVGASEVRVPPGQEAMALEVISQRARAAEIPGNPGHEFDLISVFTGVGASAEMEAISIRAVLDAAGISSVLVGAPQIPNLPFVVKVPSRDADRARVAISEAQQAGPIAAEEAERATEGS
jgi:hypothetical protein